MTTPLPLRRQFRRDPTPGARTISFGRDRILTIIEQEAGDVINLERTSPYPDRR